MKKHIVTLTDGIFSCVVLTVAFAVSLLLKWTFESPTTIPLVFVLGVFLISWRTQGYFCGIAASLISVLAVNFAFTYPYWAFDLISPECISAAVVMLIVAAMTSALTTKIKQHEKMKADAEKERMRGNLLRAVSHDLRTPLTSIYGASSAILENFDEIPREKQIKLLTDVQNDSQWLMRMVENLLSVTRIDGGNIRLTMNETVLEELIDAVLVKFRKHYPNYTVKAQLPDTFVSIPMDAMLIQQVLMNLLENAVFHAKGMENLFLTVELRNNKAVFRVIDDGCGISPTQMDGLFTDSLNRSIPTDSNRSNMGIGLSVCNAIIKAHGSELTAISRAEGGAEFSFALNMEEIIYGE